MVGIGTRRLLLVSGDQQACIDWVAGQLSEQDAGDVLWVAHRAPPPVMPVAAARVVQRLGGESRLVVIDTYQGLHPDAFAAAAGTLRGGGDCVLLTPALHDWPGYADPDKARFAAYPQTAADLRGLFIARLLRLWRDAPSVVLLTPEAPRQLCLAPVSDAPFALNAAQEETAQAVQRVAYGHARRPLVLTADRGRGKSTALGVAAARLLQDGWSRVTVVAPHKRAVQTLFRHARTEAGLNGDEVADVRIGAGRLVYRPPDACLEEPPADVGLIIVDEAAAIPVGLLERLLGFGNRLVFASTVHGYEGSGRGFRLRFESALRRLMPQWRHAQLELPTRWSPDDPLEALLNRSLLLAAEAADAADAGGPGGIRCACIEATQLASDEALLHDAFGLLVDAHYQTRPSDLRQILDNPKSFVWLARCRGHVVGVLLGSLEGGLDSAMASQVLEGQRRPRGHLLPQSLAVHAGLDDALFRSVLRVQRIAVHPGLQRQGIGRLMIDTVATWAAGRKIDLLGCAFGVDRDLLAFWSALGFRPARMGLRIDPASAAHSLFMLRGLNAAGEALCEDGWQRFTRQLPWALGGSLSQLDPGLASVLLGGRDCTDIQLTEGEQEALARVARGARQSQTAEDLLWRFLIQLAARGASGAPLQAMIAWQVQHRPLEPLCKAHGLRGRRELEVMLRDLLNEQTKAAQSTG